MQSLFDFECNAVASFREFLHLLAMVVHFCCIVISRLITKAPMMGTNVVLTWVLSTIHAIRNHSG
jgi:hypothetical protein